ncbi:MAG: hypothetical protein M1839_004599 [Geoglossum umbratile]|nr:MAG: hypothetical protein M1839_004599 [Geoglossum umbratile]
MDPLSVTASGIREVRDAPGDLRKIIIEVGSIKSVLEVLDFLISQDKSDDTRSCILEKLRSDEGEGPLDACEGSLSAIELLFPAEARNPAEGRGARPFLSLTDLRWPFKVGKARGLLEDLARHKATISLALTTDTV